MGKDGERRMWVHTPMARLGQRPAAAERASPPRELGALADVRGGVRYCGQERADSRSLGGKDGN